MTIIATSEDFTRPQEAFRPTLGRPADPSEGAPKHRILIDYKRKGMVLKAHIKQSLGTAMENARGNLEAASGIHFSYTFLVRRALDLYLREIAKMDHEMLHNEANLLKHQHR